jgi:hypothetical protein
MDQLDALIQPRLRVLQIIALALIAGLAVFAGIAVVVVHTQGRQANAAWATPVLSYTAVGYLVSAVLAWAGFPRGLETGQVARIADGPPNPLANRPGQSFGGPANDQAQLLAVRHTSTIVALAILEGAGFLGCIAYLLEGQWYALAVVGVVLLLMLATFPTQSGVRHWIEKQMGVLEDRRRAS